MHSCLIELSSIYIRVLFSGHVTDLKDTVATHVSLGKAHTVVLTSKGHVYTFGINNKGQCGREYVPGGARERKYAQKIWKDLMSCIEV